MKKSLLFTFMLILSIISCIVYSEEFIRKPAGKVVSIQGKLVISTDSGNTWQVGEINQILYEGDILKTGDYGKAAILLTDETQMKIHPRSEIVLKSVQEYVPTKEGITKVQVIGGQGWFRAKRPETKFEITTPIAVAAIRGTEVNMSVDKEKDNESVLTVIEGNVEYSSEEGSITLTDGEQGIISKGEVPKKVVLVNPDDAVQWSLYYLGVVSYRDYPFISTKRDELMQKLNIVEGIEKAKVYHDLGKIEKASDILKTLPENDEINTLLGWIALERQDIENAFVYLNKVRSKDTHAILGKSKAYYLKGQIKDAIDIIDKDTDSPILLTQLGYIYLSYGLIDKAFEYLNKAVQIDNTYWLAYGLLSNIYIVTNKNDLAKEMAEKALLFNPDSPTSNIDMSMVYQAYFDLEMAKEYAKKTVDLDPRNPFSLFHYAKLLFGFGYNREAEDIILQALQYNPNDSLINTLYGFILFSQGKTDKAIEIFNKAMQLDSTQGQPHLGLGLSYFRKKRYDEAIDEMLISTLLEPKVSLNQSYLGKSYYQLRRFQEAEDALRYAKKLDPKDPTPYLYSGNMKRDLYRHTEAVGDIQKSIELNDDRAVYRSRLLLDKDMATRSISLAEAYKELGLFWWSMYEALLSVESDITNASAHLFLADSFRQILSRTNANLSEYFQSLLLMPVNQNFFNTFNDYTAMLEVPYNRATLMGSIASPSAYIDSYKSNVEIHGGSDRYTYSFDTDYINVGGFGLVNYESEYIDETSFAKILLKPGHELYLDTFFGSQESGDPGSIIDPDPNDTRKSYAEIGRLGYHYNLRPGSDLLLLGEFIYLKPEYFSPDVDILDGDPISWLLRYYNREANVQAVHFIDLGDHQVSYGAIFGYGEEERYFKTGWLAREKIFRNEDTNKYLMLHMRDTWAIREELGLIYGVEYKRIDFGNVDLTDDDILDIIPGIKVEQLNPQLGFKYELSEDTLLRGALFRNLHYDIRASLFPSHVSGFAIEADEAPSTDKWEYNVELDYKFNDKTFFSTFLSYSEEEVLLYEDLDTIYKSLNDYAAGAIFERILAKYLTLSIQYDYEKAENPSFTGTANFLSLRLTSILPSGWKVSLVEIIYSQDFSRYFEGDTAYVTDLFISKEFFNKNAKIGLDLYNIFDNRYELNTSAFSPHEFFELNKFFAAITLEIRF